MTDIFLFPGQGSQEKGMGSTLFNRFPQLCDQANAILGYSVEELCLIDPEEKLNLTQYTQPALYVVDSLQYLARIEEEGRHPDYLAGHSLGEYCALFAAGAFDFATGLLLVQKRGELMGQAKNGGMAAVIGLSRTKIEQVIKDNGLDHLDLANDNSYQQIVLSGLTTDIIAAEPLFKKAGAKMYIPLKVSAAFHSRYMVDAQEKFSIFLDDFSFARLRVKVIANYTARPYDDGMIHDNLTRQLAHQVRWRESIEYLLGHPAPTFSEIGPGKVLTGLLRKIQKGN